MGKKRFPQEAGTQVIKDALSKYLPILKNVALELDYRVQIPARALSGGKTQASQCSDSKCPCGHIQRLSLGQDAI